jgi:hemolysin-activating ACP:hemolysin acyltransferase
MALTAAFAAQHPPIQHIDKQRGDIMQIATLDDRPRNFGRRPVAPDNRRGGKPPQPQTGHFAAIRPKNAAFALGLAVNYLMLSPAFARQPFGHWSRVLAGQINRGHYLFAIDNQKVVGFLGWSFAGKSSADDWLAGHASIPSDESRSGEIMLINAWQAKSRDALRFLLHQARFAARDCSMVYAKRYRADGSFRPVRLAVNIP